MSPDAFCQSHRGNIESGPAEIDGNGIVRVDTAALYAALDERRTSEGKSSSEVATAMESARATPDALRGLRNGGRASTQLVVSCTRWLGEPTSEFLALRPTEPSQSVPAAARESGPNGCTPIGRSGSRCRGPRGRTSAIRGPQS